MELLIVEHNAALIGVFSSVGKMEEYADQQVRERNEKYLANASFQFDLTSREVWEENDRVHVTYRWTTGEPGSMHLIGTRVVVDQPIH